MQHSKLVPLMVLKKERLTIIQIAGLIIDFYKELAILDRSYAEFTIVSEKEPLKSRIKVDELNAVQSLAEEVLNQNIEDIRRFNNVEYPDVNFSREDAINIGLEVKLDDDTFITLNYSFGSKLASIAKVVVNELCFNSFDKAKSFLEAAEKSFSIDYSVIKITDRDINKIARAYKSPLGWLTYFSNDYEIPIPDNLAGIEYKHTDKGKYLILSRENPTAPETIEANKEKLISLMKEIKEKVPGYGK